MGGSLRQLTQWSKGEYPGADNTEDDLHIITSFNGFGYRPDDHGSDILNASPLGVTGGTAVFGEGLTEQNTDTDYFSFTTKAGTINLDIDPFYRSPNLDVLATLYDTTGSPIAASNPIDLLDANLNVTLSAGTYYVAVAGVGKAAAADPGYTDYGSLGYYSITGTLAPPRIHPVVLGAGENRTGLNFGNYIESDFGDAPDSYGTTLASNGARHALTGPRLGAARDAETDGQPNATATGDDTSGATPDDEDGVSIPTLVQTETAGITVEVGGGGFVDAWIDFNGNEVWEAGEKIHSANLAAGTHVISVPVPDNAEPGITYARFRISSAGGLAPDGAADDGEVEDYQVTIHAKVVGRHVFFNNTPLDNNTPGPDPQDDNAIASGVFALLPGQSSTSDNYTTALNGLTGIMVDFAKLPIGAENNIDKEDLECRYGTQGGTWVDVEPTHVGLRRGAGSDRITIIFGDNQIPTGNWLEVTVLAGDTGLASLDRFYYGNLIGDADKDGSTLFADLNEIFTHLSSDPVPAGDPRDVDCDGSVLFADMTPTYNNISASLSQLDAPATPAGVFLGDGAGDGAAPVALGAPPEPAVAPRVRASMGGLADPGMEGDVLTGSLGGESTIADRYGARSAEDLAMAAVLDGRAVRLDSHNDRGDASVWDEALLQVAEELEDEGDEEEAPQSLLPPLRTLTRD
jgi:hypothetical protein